MKREVIDVSNWTRQQADDRHPFWWGIFGVIAIEVLVVLCFLAGYFFIWIVNVTKNQAGWPPSHLTAPPVKYPTINIGLLLICAWTMWYGGIVVHRGKIKTFFWLVVICCVCSFTLLYLRWLQFEEFSFTWRDHAYASFVWVLTGFHFMHVMAAALGTAVIGWLAYKNYYNEERSLGVQVDTMYWYFVVAAWFPIYLVIYWFPRWI